MTSYLILIRGINVGGKGKLAMADLRAHLEKLGFADVKTYINSGNVIVSSDKPAKEVKSLLDTALAKEFKLGVHNNVLVLTHAQLKAVIDRRPKGFGDDPKKYYSDAIFLMDISIGEAMKVFDPREGVDTIWPGKGVIYSQRLGELRTKSRLSKIIGTPAYKSMTIRSWNTTTKLLELMKS